MRMIPASLRRLVIQRAGDRCEYCGLSQAGQAATFYIEHITPVVANGATVAENLALATDLEISQPRFQSRTMQSSALSL